MNCALELVESILSAVWLVVLVFEHFECVIPLSLASVVEKLAVNFMGIPLYVTS